MAGHVLFVGRQAEVRSESSGVIVRRDGISADIEFFQDQSKAAS